MNNEQCKMKGTEEWRSRLLRLPFFIVPFSFCILLAADGPTDLVQRGNDALEAKQPEVALRLYEAAEERAADPGLVAFNEGVAFWTKGEFREAEVRFLRALDDRDAPPSRRARAFYNRGVCLLQRGSDTATYRAAIGCFDRALELKDAAPGIEPDARHNLELAKVLWARARTTEKTPPKASDPPPETETQPDSEPSTSDPGTTGDGGGTNQGSRAQPVGPEATRGQNPLETDQRSPGAGNMLVRLDKENPQPLTPDDARRHLERIAERLRADRRNNLQLLARPEPPHVRDW